MIVRAIDGNHDWEFGKGLNDYKSGNDAIAQTIDTRLNSFLNDCFFDAGAGIDWFQLIGGKDEISLNLSISSIILNTPNVLSLIQLSINLTSDRQFSVAYQVQTTFSTVNSTVQITI